MKISRHGRVSRAATKREVRGELQPAEAARPGLSPWRNGAGEVDLNERMDEAGGGADASARESLGRVELVKADNMTNWARKG